MNGIIIRSRVAREQQPHHIARRQRHGERGSRVDIHHRYRDRLRAAIAGVLRKTLPHRPGPIVGRTLAVACVVRE